MKKLILMTVFGMMFVGCANVAPTLTEMETENYTCVVYDNDLEENIMKCFEKKI